MEKAVLWSQESTTLSARWAKFQLQMQSLKTPHGGPSQHLSQYAIVYLIIRWFVYVLFLQQNHRLMKAGNVSVLFNLHRNMFLAKSKDPVITWTNKLPAWH